MRTVTITWGNGMTTVYEGVSQYEANNLITHLSFISDEGNEHIKVEVK